MKTLRYSCVLLIALYSSNLVRAERIIYDFRGDFSGFTDYTPFSIPHRTSDKDSAVAKSVTEVVQRINKDGMINKLVVAEALQEASVGKKRVMLGGTYYEAGDTITVNAPEGKDHDLYEEPSIEVTVLQVNDKNVKLVDKNKKVYTVVYPFTDEISTAKATSSIITSRKFEDISSSSAADVLVTFENEALVAGVNGWVVGPKHAIKSFLLLCGVHDADKQVYADLTDRGYSEVDTGCVSLETPVRVFSCDDHWLVVRVDRLSDTSSKVRVLRTKEYPTAGTLSRFQREWLQ